MFEGLKNRHCIIVTGPHRSGTTICAEMIAHDTGKPCIREEAFDNRNIIKAQRLVEQGGVIQGPYLLPWAPIFDACVVYIDRNPDEVAASVERLRVSKPFFSKAQADLLWSGMDLLDSFKIDYKSLSKHPMWRDSREGWGHRQTS